LKVAFTFAKSLYFIKVYLRCFFVILNAPQLFVIVNAIKLFLENALTFSINIKVRKSEFKKDILHRCNSMLKSTVIHKILLRFGRSHVFHRSHRQI
jgi:hypothetical protein